MTSNGPGKTLARSLRASALRRMTPAPSAGSCGQRFPAPCRRCPPHIPARRQRQREGGRDAAASGAHVEQSGGFGFGLRDPYRQLLGFGPGNQHPFVHGERAAAELRAPHDILHRTACGQLAEDVVQLRDFERRAGIGQQGRRAQPRQLRDGDEGDAPCFTRPVEGREACRNTAEYVAARGHQRMKLASAMATAASTTTAPRRATQTSWRPRIVSGSTLFVARL